MFIFYVIFSRLFLRCCPGGQWLWFPSVTVHELLWINGHFEGDLIRSTIYKAIIALMRKVLEVMDSAVHIDDVQQIIIDNLQFMMPVNLKGFSGVKSGFEKFDYQDEIIHRLRLFATERNVISLPVIVCFDFFGVRVVLC